LRQIAVHPATRHIPYRVQSRLKDIGSVLFFHREKSPPIFLGHSRDPTAFQVNQMGSREINDSSNHHHHACLSGQVIRDVALTIP